VAEGKCGMGIQRAEISRPLRVRAIWHSTTPALLGGGMAEWARGASNGGGRAKTEE